MLHRAFHEMEVFTATSRCTSQAPQISAQHSEMFVSGLSSLKKQISSDHNSLALDMCRKIGDLQLYTGEEL